MTPEYNSMVTVYSKSAHGSLNLTDNFQVKEFACNDGSDVVFINVLLPIICQMVRNWFGYPFSPTSAYRTVSYNLSDKVKGSANSLHCSGNAVDIPFKSGCNPSELFEFLDKLFHNTFEIGLYSWGCHLGITSDRRRFLDKSYTEKWGAYVVR